MLDSTKKRGKVGAFAKVLDVSRGPSLGKPVSCSLHSNKLLCLTLLHPSFRLLLFSSSFLSQVLKLIL